MLDLCMNKSSFTAYYMKDIYFHDEFMNEYGLMQWYYINGGGGDEGGLKRQWHNP